MNEENPAGKGLSFGEELLGMQGFSAERAKQYRKEIQNLLEHRLSRSERWIIGVQGAAVGTALVAAGIMLAITQSHTAFEGMDEVRQTFAATAVLTGLLFGTWLLWIAIKGGYRRQLGETVGLAMTLVLSVGCGYGLIRVAWVTSDTVLRAKMLAGGGVLFIFPVGCILLALLRRMHRQTQEKLLRIEYHLAELMARNAGSTH